MKHVDTKEVQKFSSIAHEWWNETGKFKPLHEINPLRISYIKEHIVNHFKLHDDTLPQINILDVGCGGGLVSAPLARIGFRVTGLDASLENIEVAQSYVQDNTVNSPALMHASTQDIPDHSFNAVLALEVIEHVPDPEFFMKDITRIIRPGGMLFLSTINRNLKSLLLAKVAAEYILRWVPANTHSWNKFLKPSEILRLIGKSLQFKDITGIRYNILLQKWELVGDTGMNYILCAIKK